MATFGFAASVGSYFGSLCTLERQHIYALIPALALSITIGVISSRGCIKIIAISLGIFLVFTARSLAETDTKIPPWVTILNGEVVQLQCVVTTDPHVMPRASGPMSRFEHRSKVTRFYARATPIDDQKFNYQPFNISVRIDKPRRINKGDSITCIGWLRESSVFKKRYSLFVFDIEMNRGTSNSIQYQEIGLRKSIQEKLTRGLSQVHQSLARALFFGIRDQGWSTVTKIFRRAGMSHILAISGLHVGLIVMIVLGITSSLCRKRVVALVVALFVIGAVLLFVELRSPAIRAALMISIVSAGRYLGVRCNTVGLLGFAAIVMLIIKPADASTVGYQLSFIVVASLCVLLPQIKWRILGPADVNSSTINTSIYWISSMWLTGLCALMVSSPYTAAVFGTVSPSGLLSNIPSIGLLTVSLLGGTARLLAGLTNPILDNSILVCFSLILHVFLTTAEWFGSVPFSYLQGVHISWCWAIALIFWFICWSITIRKRWRVWGLLFCIAVGMKIDLLITENKVIITTLDVGHGTCHIIQHGAHTILIDGGSIHNLDVGTNTIIPALLNLGIGQIDFVIVTHSDIDHCGGIASVLQSIPVSNILIAPQAYQHKSAPMSLVLETASNNNARIVRASKGWVTEMGDLRISIISPDVNESYRSPNATCIVTLLEAFGRSVLFTGDIDDQKIKEINQWLPKHVDVVELPHHGEWGEFSAGMIRLLSPRFVIQSVNLARHATDIWRFPKGCDRFTTAVDGTITTTMYKDGDVRISGSTQPVSMTEWYSQHY